MAYNFDYFRGNEAEEYRFYMIPQLLFTNDMFKKLSSDAKILYGLMLDRVSLSYKNEERFTDEVGRAFIYFTRETAMDMLNCGKNKATEIYNELENIGLIERKRQGLGKPTKIYVKHFNRFTNANTGLQEDRKSGFKRVENQTSRGLKNKPQEDRKSDTIHTNINQTDIINTHSINQAENSDEKERMSERAAQNNLSYSEIISEIGYHSLFVPETEKEMFEPDYDKLKNCQIPYSFSDSLRNTKMALAFVFGYNYYSDSMDDLDKNLFCDCINNLAEMMTGKNGYNAHMVIDKFNEMLTRSNPYDWFVSFIGNWTDVNIDMAEKNVKIKFPNAFMKKCMYNWFDNYLLSDDCMVRSIPNIPIPKTEKTQIELTPVSEIIERMEKETTERDRNSEKSPSDKIDDELPDTNVIPVVEPVRASECNDEKEDFISEDYTLKNGMNYSDVISIVSSSSMLSAEKQTEWLDENVQGWRNSESFLFCFIKKKLNL